jgi:hypothetical protein
MPTHSPDSRRSFLKKMGIIPAAAMWGIPDQWSPDFEDVNKIDIHTHISTDASYLREVMDDLNLKMFTICNEGLKVDRLDAQVKAAIEITKAHPRYYAWATTFGFDNMYDPGWADQVNEYLEHGFHQGALAVKVWKEIGMQVKDPSGQLVQIDDPIFDPILDYIGQENKTLLAHIADPVQRWLSFDSDWEHSSWYREGAGVDNRVGTFRGEVSYDRMILARDRMLAKHPDLRVIGFHLGSMEFDVLEVAERLDRYPNFAVSTGNTIRHLMKQSRELVRWFFLEYQDRIMYGSDISGGTIATRYLIDMAKIGERWTNSELEEEKENLLARYEEDFSYFATDNEMDQGKYTITGLALPSSVLKKVFYDNAVKWVPGINKDFN